jgi:hypothetical protein
VLAPESHLQGETRLTRGDDYVQSVLDTLPVTDTVYHHLAFTRPLVDALVGAVRLAVPAGRVLVIGPNELLPRVLVEFGYDVDLWVPDGLPLSQEMQRLASRKGALDDILGIARDHSFDVIVVPYVAEAVTIDPARLLLTLSGHLKSDGFVVLACRQPGELRRRLREAFRKVDSPTKPANVYPLSPTWPAPPAKRLLTKNDLAHAGAGRFRVVAAELIIGHRAYLTTEPLGVWKWIVRVALHLTKVAVPTFRDSAMFVLVHT